MFFYTFLNEKMIYVRSLHTHDMSPEYACDMEDAVRRINAGYTRNIWKWNGDFIVFSHPIAEQIRQCNVKWASPVLVSLDASKPGIDVMPVMESMRSSDEIVQSQIHQYFHKSVIVVVRDALYTLVATS